MIRNWHTLKLKHNFHGILTWRKHCMNEKEKKSNWKCCSTKKNCISSFYLEVLVIRYFFWVHCRLNLILNWKIFIENDLVFMFLPLNRTKMIFTVRYFEFRLTDILNHFLCVLHLFFQFLRQATVRIIFYPYQLRVFDSLVWFGTYGWHGTMHWNIE